MSSAPSSSPPTSPTGRSPLLPRAALGGLSVPPAFRSLCSTRIGSVVTGIENQTADGCLIREGTRHGDCLQFFVSGLSFRSAYTVEHRIGEGGFGKVYAARNNALQIPRAVKRLKKTDAMCEMYKNELAALLALDHPHIVKLVEYYDQEDEYLYLVFELCTGPDLYNHIFQQPQRRMTEYDAAVALRHMLKALQCCHADHRGHFDIKPENFMYTNEHRNNLKMIDLGLSGGFERNKANQIKGTQVYMAPELWDGIYGPEGDVWSCGVVLYVMLTGEHFLNDVPREEMRREIKVRGKMRQRLSEAIARYNLSEASVNLLRLMLQHDRHARPTVKECLKHPFITSGYQLETDPTWCEKFPVKEALYLRSQLPEVFRAVVKEPMLKRVSRLAVAHAGPACHPERLVFRMLDKHGYGEISIGVLEQDFETRGAPIPEDLDMLFEAVDLFRCGYLSSLEFLAATLPTHMCNDVNLCRVAFDIIDQGKDGFIDANDIAQLFGHENGSLICQKVIAEVCHDAYLSFDNFVQIMHVD